VRALIVEDDFASRIVMKKFLAEIGPWDTQMAIDGVEGVDAFLQAHKESEPYELICLDIMLPRVDGINVLRIIRQLEKEHGYVPAKIMMTTALYDKSKVDEAFALGCQAYCTKPLDLQKIRDVMGKLGLP